MAAKIWKFFTSVKLTIVLFVLILIPSIIGTFIQQNAPDPGRYLEIYGPMWNSIFRFLGFYDVYHDPRFIVLLVLLGLNTFVCTVNRFRPRWRLLGMLMTHCGLLLILAGALVGAIMGEKGFIGIREGETTDRMSTGRATGAPAVLPFRVGLVDFILDRHEEPVHKLFVFDIATRTTRSHTIKTGHVVPLSPSKWQGMAALVGIELRSRGTIKVNRFLPNAVLVTSLTEGPEETGIIAMEFRCVRDEEEERGIAFSQPEHPYILENAPLAVGYKTVNGAMIEEAIQAALSQSRTANHVEVTVPGTGEKQAYPADVGTMFKVEGTDHSVEVLRYVPDFVRLESGEVLSRSDSPRNPAIQIRITGSSGAEDHWFFSKFPTMHKSSDIPLDIKFIYENHLGNIGDYLLVLNTVEGSAILAHVRSGELMGKTVIEPGKPTDIAGTDYAIVVDGFFENANMVNEVVERSDVPGRPAVEIELEQNGLSSVHHLLESSPIEAPGYRMAYERQNTVRDFYSILQILIGDRVVAEKKIEVNNPVRYEGYTIYQSKHNLEDPVWSGLEVKKDPGIPLVYAGFSVQILGMIVIFYINPLLRKVKKSGT